VTLPYLLQVAYDYPAALGSSDATTRTAFPAELREHIPNRYRQQPTFMGGKIDSTVAMESMVLVATRELQDEEVFMNYRLSAASSTSSSSSSALPDWYSPVNAEEDVRRWEGVLKQ
jgi:hypothetical protein